jgi:hypothetical protein
MTKYYEYQSFRARIRDGHVPEWRREGGDQWSTRWGGAWGEERESSLLRMLRKGWKECSPDAIDIHTEPATTTTKQTGEGDSMATQATVYEVTMIKRATCKEQEAGGRDVLVLPPVSVLADGTGQAIAAVTKAHAKVLDQHDVAGLDIKVREFRG